MNKGYIYCYSYDLKISAVPIKTARQGKVTYVARFISLSIYKMCEDYWDGGVFEQMLLSRLVREVNVENNANVRYFNLKQPLRKPLSKPKFKALD